MCAYMCVAMHCLQEPLCIHLSVDAWHVHGATLLTQLHAHLRLVTNINFVPMNVPISR